MPPSRPFHQLEYRALTSYVMAISVLAVTRLPTSLAVRLGRTRVLTYRSGVARSTFEFASHVITR